MVTQKKYLIYIVYISVFFFPGLVATVKSGGAPYALILLLGLALAWGRRPLEPWEKKVLVGFAIFFLLISLSLFYTQDLSNGVKKLGRYVHFPLFIPMYFLLIKYRVETGRVFLFGVIASSVIMLGQAVYQVNVLGWSRAVGANNAIIFGDIAMLMSVIIGCALLTVAEKWQHFIVGGCAVVLALVASIMSASKGAWILVPVIVVWFLWIKRKSMGKHVMVAIFLLSIVSIFGVSSVDKVKSRIDVALKDYKVYTENVGLEGASSVGERLEMWRDSIMIWKAHPVLGTGIGDYGNDRLQLYTDGKSNLGTRYTHAHSIYFDVLATAGIVGLLSMLILMQILPFQMFYTFWIKEHDIWIKFYALSGMTTIIAFAVFGLTEAWIARNAFVRTYLMCILVFMSSIAVVKAKEAEIQNP